MYTLRTSNWCLVAAVVALGTSLGFQKSIAAEADSADSEEGVQVLVRGPVHEAFAEIISFDPEPGIVVPKTPPAAIEELPPDQKPEGANVAWIPGYWAWDDERTDFLWVSGIWRDLPPGRQWVSGYWGNSGQGSQWTSGYWADAEASEVEYLPEPPQSVEAGPNIDAPSVDDSWIPGCWVWHQGRYAWRPGYWATVQSDWVWIPDHYVASPRGYVYVEGYWDYSVGRRGLLFAPVYFNTNVSSRRGFTYSPATVINLAVFGDQLFLRPTYNHYYFGDYYAANYHQTGFYPSYSFASSRYGYDPFFAHERWQHRDDRDWEHRVEADFKNRRDHEDARPSRSLAAQQELNKSGVKLAAANIVVAASIDQLAKSQDSPIKFQPIDKQERQKLAERGQELQKLRDQRQKLEAKTAATSAKKPSAETQPSKVRLPTSPIMGKATAELGKDHAPPQRHEVLKPVLDVEPKPRVSGDKAESLPDSPKAGKTEPTAAPKGEPHPTPKDEPKPRPKVETKPTPKVEPKPLPKVEPKSAPKVERKPSPKIEPKPTRQVKPNPTPPRGEDNDKPKGGSQDKPKSESSEKPKK